MIRDIRFWLALAAGPAAVWGLSWLPGLSWSPGWPPGSWQWPVLAILVYPPLEETVFRGGVQPWLAVRTVRRWGPLSAANVGTSLLFSVAHLPFQPPWWAAAVLLPSLVFGYFRERHDGLAAPITLHAAYNASYVLLLS